jgi:hypothetical protein
MTAKRPRDPNQLGKLIVDIADPLPNVPRNETGIITENGECFSGPRVSPDMGCRGSRTNDVHGGCSGGVFATSP